MTSPQVAGYFLLPEISGGSNHEGLKVSEKVLDLGLVDSNDGG